MRKFALTILTILAIIGGSQNVYAGSKVQCTEYTLTADGTVGPFETSDKAGSVGSWLNINTTGAGTPVVTTKIYGKLPGKGSAYRPNATLCTMNAATTYCNQPAGTTAAIGATLSGCSSCEVIVQLCGVTER